MLGVKFNNFHSYNDFGLLLSKKSIGSPQPKSELLEVPGADEMLDFTEFFGDVKYKNRPITLDFSTLVPINKFFSHFSMIHNALHGRKMQIVFDGDPDFYYSGRVSVKEWEFVKTIGKVTIECDCDPYKYKKNKTVKEVTVAGEKTIELNNLRKWVTPVIKTTSNVRIEYGSNSYSISAGEVTVPEIVLKDGINTMTIHGNSTVTITYQEGGF